MREPKHFEKALASLEQKSRQLESYLGQQQGAQGIFAPDLSGLAKRESVGLSQAALGGNIDWIARFNEHTHTPATYCSVSDIK